jgi:hypothetical protein
MNAKRLNTTKNIVLAAGFASYLALSYAWARQADDTSAVITMKPMQGMNFDAGSEHEVTYFISQDGQCRLVVTRATEPGSDAPNFTATRFEATINAGETTRYVSDSGRAVDFDCEPTARTVSIRPVQQADAVANR